MEGQFFSGKKAKGRMRLAFCLALVAVACGMEKHLLLALAALMTTGQIFLMNFNRHASFRIEEGRIHARYHWFGKLDCSLDEVVFAYAQYMTLNILLKDGKRCAIACFVNAAEVCNEIQRQKFAIEQDSTDALRKQLNQIHLKRRREIYWVIAASVMLFANIFLAVWMTGGRELFEFSRRDWILFSIVAVIEAATLVGTFALACRGGRWMLDLAYLRHRLQGAAIVTQVLPSACMKAVYTDLEFNGRLVVCGLPNDGSLYYIVQEFDDDFHLTTTETSRFFDNDSDLLEDLSADLIDITGYFF